MITYRNTFDGNPDHVTLGIWLGLRLGEGSAGVRDTGCVLPGDCFTVTILRSERTWRRYALCHASSTFVAFDAQTSYTLLQVFVRFRYLRSATRRRELNSATSRGLATSRASFRPTPTRLRRWSTSSAPSAGTMCRRSPTRATTAKKESRSSKYAPSSQVYALTECQLLTQ